MRSVRVTNVTVEKAVLNIKKVCLYSFRSYPACKAKSFLRSVRLYSNSLPHWRFRGTVKCYTVGNRTTIRRSSPQPTQCFRLRYFSISINWTGTERDVSIAYLKDLIRHHPKRTEEKLKKLKVSVDMDRQSKATHPDKNTGVTQDVLVRHHADVVTRKTWTLKRCCIPLYSAVFCYPQLLNVMWDQQNMLFCTLLITADKEYTKKFHQSILRYYLKVGETEFWKWNSEAVNLHLWNDAEHVY
jgi:hypothetical protein